MFHKLILNITLFISCIPVLFYKARKTGHLPDVRFIAPFLWLLLLSSIYEKVFTGIFRIDTAIWFRLYPLLEFLCLVYFFDRLLNRAYRVLFLVFLGFFIFCFTFFLILWILNGYSKVDSYLTVIETVFVYSASLLWFKDLFTNMELKSLWDSPAFYFISGFILYFSGTLFLFLMSDFVFTSEQMVKYWIINILLSLFLDFILIIGIWKGQHKSIRYSG